MSTPTAAGSTRVEFSHTDPGTDESAWQAIDFAALPRLELEYARIVVLAAHPDDETLGAGGLLSRASTAGVPVTIVVATDGEGSHPGVEGIAARRRGELEAAVDEVAPRADVRMLHLPDGGLREHRDELTRAVGAVLAETAPPGAVLVVAPWWGDGHRDHRIAGEVAQSFASDDVDVRGYPIWFWHWGDPASTDTASTDTASTDTASWSVLPLSEDDRRRKAAALAHMTSQTLGDEPILHAGMRAHFEREVEVFIGADSAVFIGAGRADREPRRDHERLPHQDFEAFHRRHADPWGLASKPYEDRKRGILLDSLPHDRYRRGLEIGCAHGVLTALLTDRCDELVAVDLSRTALRRARERVGDDASVSFRETDVRESWPDEAFDLVVLSEVAYYWTPAEFSQVIERLRTGLLPGASVVLCHWRHDIEGAPSRGDRVHAQFAEESDLRRVVEHRERDFVLEVFERGEGGTEDSA